MEDYKKKYEAAIKQAKEELKTCGSSDCDAARQIFRFFPELKESEDERIRKWLIKAMKHLSEESTFFLEVPKDKVIAWLEGQCEQKPADKVESKFKVGDWVRAISSGNIFKILSVNDGLYRVLCYDGVEANYPIEVEKDLEYWTQDAWDDDKKELRKIEQENYELPNGEDFGIDSLYHAARILEKTLGEVDGYQSDDGILEHKCAIEVVNRLYKQKPAWSEEDEKMLENVISSINHESVIEGLKSRGISYSIDSSAHLMRNLIDWLKSLKEKMKGE